MYQERYHGNADIDIGMLTSLIISYEVEVVVHIHLPRNRFPVVYEAYD